MKFIHITFFRKPISRVVCHESEKVYFGYQTSSELINVSLDAQIFFL